jgi:entericidin A
VPVVVRIWSVRQWRLPPGSKAISSMFVHFKSRKQTGENMRKVASLFLLIASVYLLAGCNTMHGFGKDMQNLGDKIQNKSAQ